MARRVKVHWKRGVFAEIRTLPAVMSELDSMAGAIANRAGDGFEARPAEKTGGKVRGRAAVVTATNKAARRNAREQTLLKSMDAGRRG